MLFAAIALLVLTSCAESKVQESGGSTNWLVVCSNDADCTEGSCLCGVCSKPCTSNAQCSSSFEGSCVDVTSTVGASTCFGEHPGVDALCLPSCEDERACGDGFACRNGLCVTNVVSERIDQALMPIPDGSTPNDAGPDGCTFQEVWCDGSTPPEPGIDGGPTDSGVCSGDPSCDAGPLPTDGAVIQCDCDEDLLSLDCVCSQITCPSYEDVLAQNCQGGNPNPSLYRVGCGSIVITRSAGLGKSTHVFEAETHTVIGRAYTDDVTSGVCERNRYATEIPDLTGCEDYTVCSLCEGSSESLCDFAEP